MFVLVDLLAKIHTEFVGMVMIGLRKKVHMLSSNVPLAIATEPKTKYRFHAEATALFYVTQRNTFKKRSHFSYFSTLN
jgi:hypothetical protein